MSWTLTVDNAGVGTVNFGKTDLCKINYSNYTYFMESTTDMTLTTSATDIKLNVGTLTGKYELGGTIAEEPNAEIDGITFTLFGSEIVIVDFPLRKTSTGDLTATTAKFSEREFKKFENAANNNKYLGIKNSKVALLDAPSGTGTGSTATAVTGLIDLRTEDTIPKQVTKLFTGSVGDKVIGNDVLFNYFGATVFDFTIYTKSDTSIIMYGKSGEQDLTTVTVASTTTAQVAPAFAPLKAKTVPTTDAGYNNSLITGAVLKPVSTTLTELSKHTKEEIENMKALFTSSFKEEKFADRPLKAGTYQVTVQANWGSTNISHDGWYTTIDDNTYVKKFSLTIDDTGSGTVDLGTKGFIQIYESPYFKYFKTANPLILTISATGASLNLQTITAHYKNGASGAETSGSYVFAGLRFNLLSDADNAIIDFPTVDNEIGTTGHESVGDFAVTVYDHIGEKNPVPVWKNITSTYNTRTWTGDDNGKKIKITTGATIIDGTLHGSPATPYIRAELYDPLHSTSVLSDKAQIFFWCAKNVNGFENDKITFVNNDGSAQETNFFNLEKLEIEEA